MKLPRPRVYVAAVKDLFEFHGLEAKFDFEDLADPSSRSPTARAASSRARSTCATPTARVPPIHLARSPWDPGPGGDLQPEAQVVDAKFLAAKRKEVDDAVKAAEKLRALTDKLLRDSHEQRARPGFDRRKAR